VKACVQVSLVRVVNPLLISISFSNLSQHFKAAAARGWLQCLGTSVSASLPEEGWGAQTPLLLPALQDTLFGSLWSSCCEGWGKVWTASWQQLRGCEADPGRCVECYSGRRSATRSRASQFSPAFYRSECQHMGEERADGCTAAERLWCWSLFHVLTTVLAGAVGAFPLPQLQSQADRLSPLILPGARALVFQEGKPRWRHFSKMLKKHSSWQTF